MDQSVDVVIVGAGIMGLAHAWSAAKRGLRVRIFERNRIAQGASIRNFGMVWPIGQKAGFLHQIAMRSRACWLELAKTNAIWLAQCGSLHLAYAEDEAMVLREFHSQSALLGYQCQYLTSKELIARFPSVQSKGLLGGLWSDTELGVNPPEAIAQLGGWLQRNYSIEIVYGATVTAIEYPKVRLSDQTTHQAEKIIIASGVDFQTLYPEIYQSLKIHTCKLQMMRTVAQPSGWQLGSHIAGGLTLAHYPAFEICPTLPELKKRFQKEMPEYVRYGIHVMASQTNRGEIIIGDSHEYDEAIDPFDSTEIDQLIVDYLQRMLKIPDRTIASRWHGLYAKHFTEPMIYHSVQPGVTIANAPGGAGMTMSFGWAEHWWDNEGK